MVTIGILAEGCIKFVTTSLARQKDVSRCAIRDACLTTSVAVGLLVHVSSTTADWWVSETSYNNTQREKNIKQCPIITLLALSENDMPNFNFYDYPFMAGFKSQQWIFIYEATTSAIIQ